MVKPKAPLSQCVRPAQIRSLQSPKVTFETKIYHCNVNNKGEIGLGILTTSGWVVTSSIEKVGLNEWSCLFDRKSVLVCATWSGPIIDPPSLTASYCALIPTLTRVAKPTPESPFQHLRYPRLSGSSGTLFRMEYCLLSHPVQYLHCMFEPWLHPGSAGNKGANEQPRTG